MARVSLVSRSVGGNLLKMWEEICLKCGRKSARQQSRNLETAATPLRLALASEKVFGPCSLYSGIEGWKETSNLLLLYFQIV